MDSVTHALFGLTQYGAINKNEMDEKLKRAVFTTTLVGSEIPDIDVISQLWDETGMYQMWHRGITHSLFMVPIWAFLIALLCTVIFRTKHFPKLFLIGTIAVFIHSTSDLFNAWGTGYFEPFTQLRITLGTIPIIDFIFWLIMFGAMFFGRRLKGNTFKVYRVAWLLIGFHVLIQSVQGYVLYQQYENKYDQLALSASFLPWHFTVIGKTDNKVELVNDSLLREAELVYSLQSAEDADLERLFSEVPEAETLYNWAPFVVVVDDDERLGLYDPRFYRNGQSFLFEYIEKNQK
ncbi:metal-dependent hydrolase [Bacillus timonensis]|nr:metal-dependent hydrolase [Bacillus timonensis]